MQVRNTPSPYRVCQCEQPSEAKDGLGWHDGDPYPMNWPTLRAKVRPVDRPAKTIDEAFNWPVVVKKNLKEILRNLGPNAGTPIICTGRLLKMTSNFSGICTQSRAAAVLQSHEMGVSFKHVRDPSVFLVHVA